MYLGDFMTKHQELINDIFENLKVKIPNNVKKIFVNKLQTKTTNADKVASVLFLISLNSNIIKRNILNESELVKLFCILIFDCEINKYINEHFNNSRFYSNLTIFKNEHSSFTFWNKLVNEINTNKYMFCFSNFEFNGLFCNSEVIKWFCDNIHPENNDYANKKIKQLSELKILTKSSYLNHMNNNIIPLFELSIKYGYSVDYIQAKKIARNIAYIYTLSNDVSNLMTDLINGKSFSINYCINFGIISTYDEYMKNKSELLINLCDTKIENISKLKQLVNIFENKIDYFIDNTNPDICSTSYITCAS